MSKEVSEVLFKAAQLIERDGWCQGDYQDGICLCPLGAIRVALGLNVGQENAEEIMPACNFIREFLGTPVWGWNDKPERTAEEVIDALVIASVEAAQEDF